MDVSWLLNNEEETAGHSCKDGSANGAISPGLMRKRRQLRLKKGAGAQAKVRCHGIHCSNRKSRSLYGVSPSAQLGPKAALCQDSTLVIQDPSAQKLKWSQPPLNALIIRKPCDHDINGPYKKAVELLTEKKMMVYVEEGTLDGLELPPHCMSKVTQFNSGKDDLIDKIDFIVTLGGDGTLIHASSLFQESVPPILAFNMGSLGFLTPFNVDTMADDIDKAVVGDMGLMLRSRLKCVIGPTTGHQHSNSFNVVNEVVIDRGPSPYLCHIDLYVNDRPITSVQGDGLIISTPTGSTAYAAAAGASMMHPSVPAILVVPVCAHSLSFRPIVLPAGVKITVVVSPEARNPAWVAFDGRNRKELNHGDTLRITTSIYPLPSLCKVGQLEDWFSSLSECLHWNVRRPQKALATTGSSASLNHSMSAASLTDDSSTSSKTDY